MALKIGIFSLEKKCGKSTSAAYLAESFSTLGSSVLLIDLNSSTFLKSYLSISTNESFSAESASELSDRFIQIRKSQSSWKYYHLGHNFEIENFKNDLKEIEDTFDYIFFDFPSFESELSENILKLLNSVIIPIECEFYGIDNLSLTLEKIIQNEGLLIEGILLTKYDANNQLVPKVIDYLKENFSEMMFNTIISRNYYLAVPKFSIENLNHVIPHIGFADYLKLANEIIEKKKNE